MRMAAMLMLAGTLCAHHSTAPFDMTKDVTIRGTVAEFRWANPHSYILLDIDGKRWTIEAEALNLLRRHGWTKDTLKPGDEISCLGARARDPEVLAMKCFWIWLADGRKLAATPVGPPDDNPPVKPSEHPVERR